ncbi:MAG: hypothetical protein WBG92_17205 [Thiohalocapsa sp.]
MQSDTASQQTRIAETFRDAEQAGLRIAIKGRLVALAILGVFLVGSRIQNPDHALELGLSMALFAVLGIIQYVLIGSHYDRPWLKYTPSSPSISRSSRF